MRKLPFNGTGGRMREGPRPSIDVGVLLIFSGLAPTLRISLENIRWVHIIDSCSEIIDGSV